MRTNLVLAFAVAGAAARERLVALAGRQLGRVRGRAGGGRRDPQVVTPSLLTVTAHEPRKVVGTVSMAEFLVAVSVSTGFILSFVGITSSNLHAGIPWLPVLGLCIGGVLIAPLAARLAGRLPQAPMGAMVGGLVVIVNAINVVAALGGLPWYADLAGLLAAALVTGLVARRAWRRERRNGPVAPANRDERLAPVGS